MESKRIFLFYFFKKHHFGLLICLGVISTLGPRYTIVRIPRPPGPSSVIHLTDKFYTDNLIPGTSVYLEDKQVINLRDKLYEDNLIPGFR